MLYRARLECGNLIVTEDNSKDLKVAVGVERSLRGSRRRNAVPQRLNKCMNQEQDEECS